MADRSLGATLTAAPRTPESPGGLSLEAPGFRALAPAAFHPRVDIYQRLERYGLPQDLDEFVRRDPYPLPDIPDRGGYHGERHFAFWVSGLCDYSLVCDGLRRHGVPLRRGDEMLDLGCLSGRVLRHFACQGDGLTCWGVDIKRRGVEWCGHFLPPNVRAFVGVLYPRLPIPDASLALVTAFSVFTHIDEFETAWLAELRRVLRPGGAAWVTIHSERLWTRMDPGRDPIYNALISLKDSREYPVDPEQFKRPMPTERVAFPMGPTRDQVNVFHSDRYLRRVWGRYFEVAEIIDEPARTQADVLLIKRETVAPPSFESSR